MSVKSFDELVTLIQEDITSTDTRMRDSVSPEEKVAVTLRYLAMGCSFGELHFNYCLGKSTTTGIVRQVCEALWRLMARNFVPKPKRANFPNCIGAVNGKHARITMPEHSGSLYHNYKHYFSIVLFSNLRRQLLLFLRDYGKNSDSVIFKNSNFYKRLLETSLNIPTAKPIYNADTTPLPHVLVGDEAFALMDNIMRPYAGNSL
ncbi:hypothetical protein PR048_021980 [Dryococelus australis]|uniref:DDE Tnp4 domain-containing protein n=1 Tax=Dryococelus australis TaxID=614101 RepID=A0ABQ9GZS7_9NEOP|nr:hypothetical protein PR048_021980 [Dryococelus australis]